MLKKRERLSRQDFERTFARGVRRHSHNLTLISAPSPQPRCAVVVSKKTAKNAPARNTLRRRTYMMLATLRPLWSDTNIIVLLRPQAARLAYHDLFGELQELMRERNPSR